MPEDPFMMANIMEVNKEPNDSMMMGDDLDVAMEDDMMMKAFMDDSMVDHATELALNTIVGGGGGGTGNARQVSDSTNETSGSSSPSNVSPVLSSTNAESPTTDSTPVPAMTGRPGIPLYLSCNPDYLSEYQCLIRKNIELFEANSSDVSSRVKGRNKPIVLGQVGIRCRFCSHICPVDARERGSTYYPHTLVGIYQAAQILSQQHLLETCTFVPPQVREELCALKNKKSFATAGKEYWAETAKVLGVYEDQHGLRFEKRLGLVRDLGPH